MPFALNTLDSLLCLQHTRFSPAPEPLYLLPHCLQSGSLDTWEFAFFFWVFGKKKKNHFSWGLPWRSYFKSHPPLHFLNTSFPFYMLGTVYIFICSLLIYTRRYTLCKDVVCFVPLCSWRPDVCNTASTQWVSFDYQYQWVTGLTEKEM